MPRVCGARPTAGRPPWARGPRIRLRLLMRSPNRPVPLFLVAGQRLENLVGRRSSMTGPLSISLTWAIFLEPRVVTVIRCVAHVGVADGLSMAFCATE